MQKSRFMDEQMVAIIREADQPIGIRSPRFPSATQSSLYI